MFEGSGVAKGWGVGVEADNEVGVEADGEAILGRGSGFPFLWLDLISKEEDVLTVDIINSRDMG